MEYYLTEELVGLRGKFEELALPGRTLIREGTLKLILERPQDGQYFYLCNDVLIYTYRLYPYNFCGAVIPLRNAVRRSQE
jgi:hypothetical protein